MTAASDAMRRGSATRLRRLGWLAAVVALGVGWDHARVETPAGLPGIAWASVGASPGAAVGVRPPAGAGPRGEMQRTLAVPAADDPLGLARLARRTQWPDGPPTNDPFAAPPVVRPTAAAAPASAVAVTPPSFPYPWIGSWLEDGVRSAFLARGDGVLWLRAGDTVDGHWRVESVEAGALHLSHLPSGQSVTVSAGGRP